MAETEKKPKKGPKKRVNSKGKGSGFEGRVAKLLSEKLGPLQFMRSQSSGARVGGKNFELLGKKFGQAGLVLFVGDVVPINEDECDRELRFTIETKFYKTPDSFDSLLTGNANVYKWMNEALTDCGKVGRRAVLIFKWNNTPIYVAVDKVHATFPDMIKFFELQHGICVCYLDDLLKYPEWWVNKKPQMGWSTSRGIEIRPDGGVNIPVTTDPIYINS